MKSKKLSLDKIRVARLNNPEKIIGGKKETESIDPKICKTWHCNISTKTGLIRRTALCFK